MLVMYEIICPPASSPTENIKLVHVEQNVVADTGNLRTLEAEAGGSRAGWRIGRVMLCLRQKKKTNAAFRCAQFNR